MDLARIHFNKVYTKTIIPNHFNHFITSAAILSSLDKKKLFAANQKNKTNYANFRQRIQILFGQSFLIIALIRSR